MNNPEAFLDHVRGVHSINICAGKWNFATCLDCTNNEGKALQFRNLQTTVEHLKTHHNCEAHIVQN